MMRKLISSLRQNTSGAAAVLFALMLPPLLGIGAVSVDLASMYLAERKLQGVADAAAAAAVEGDIVDDGHDAAQAMIDQSNLSNVNLVDFTTGSYERDASIDFDERFTPNDPEVNAARLVLRQQVPLFFASVIFGRQNSDVVAEATAARSDMVAFDLGSKLLTANGGLPNALLSQLAGVGLNLSDADIAKLVATQVDVVTLANALRTQQGEPNRLFGEVYDTPSSLSQIVKAMAVASPDPQAATLLNNLAGNLAGDDVTMSQLIDIGPYASHDVDDGRTGVKVDLYTLLRATLEASHGPHYTVDLNVTVPGMASAKLRLAGGYSYERSPFLSISNAGDVTLRTALTRVYLEGTIAPALSQLVSIKLPLFVELAPATAQITDVNCDVGSTQQGVTVEVTPSLGTAAIANVATDQFDNLSAEPSLQDAMIVDTLLIDITGYSRTSLGGDDPQDVSFSADEIAAGVRKDIGTSNLISGTLASLIGSLNLQVKLAGLSLGLNKTTLANSATTSLLSVAPAVDNLVNSITDAAGLKIGVAQVGINRLSCGQPAIVG
jgi:uncharacterized membrane protein